MHRFIRFKIFAPLAVVVGVAGLAITALYASHARFEADTIAAFQRHQLTTARSIAVSVEEVFDEVGEDLDFLRRDPDIIEMTSDAQREITSFLETHSDVLHSIAVTDAVGNVVRRAPLSSTAENIAHRPGFEAARDTEGIYVSEPVSDDENTAVRIVRVLAPIRREGKFVGIIWSGVDLSKVWVKCLARPETGRKSFCWVVKEDGDILYDTDNRYQGRTWEQVEEEWHASGGHGTEEEEAAEKHLRDRVRRGEEGIATCWNNNAGRVNELIAFTPIRLGNETYGLAVITPESEISAPIHAHGRLTAALIAALVVVCAASGYVAYRGGKAEVHLREERARSLEREKAEERLRTSQAFLQTVIDAIPEPMIAITLDHRVTLANKAAREKNDRRDPVSDHLTCHRLFHQRPTPCSGADGAFPLEQVVTTGAPVLVTHTHRNARGEESIVEVTAAPIFDDSGKVIQVVESCRDITERKRATKALRESQASLAKAQEIAHLGNWDWNIVTDELRWSDEIYRIFGLRPQEFGATYEAFSNFVHPDDRDLVRKSMEEALYQNKPYSMDHRILLPTGEVRVVHEEGEVTSDESGRPTRMVGTVQDVTELKRAEEELRYRMDELERFNRLAVGREGRMIELKHEVNEMARKVGLAPPYDLAFADPHLLVLNPTSYLIHRTPPFTRLLLRPLHDVAFFLRLLKRYSPSFHFFHELKEVLRLLPE